MAKISELTELGSLADEDAVPCLDDSASTAATKNKRFKLSTLKAWIQTAAELLTAIKTVDGTGSGLDADTVDGSHAADFATAAQGSAADAAKTKTDYLTVTGATDLDTIRTKAAHLTVTASTNLDSIRTRVDELDAAIVLKGLWDASGGSFPGSGAAQAGWSYIVSVAGTVGGVAFAVNDRVIAIADNASTSTYASNWHKADYTDEVLSLAGLTGAISAAGLRTAINVEDGADATDAANVGAAIHGATAKTTPVDADTVGLIDSASNALKKLTWANIKATLKTYFDTLYSPALVTERAVGDAAATLVLTDAGKLVSINSGSARTWTIPPNADVAFPIGTEVAGTTLGSGAVTVTPGSGVTLRSNGGALVSDGQYSTWAAVKIGTNEWLVAGRLTT